MTPGARAIRTTAAVLAPAPRAFFWLRGERPLGYLHDVLTQDVAGLTPGNGALAAVLTDRGRVTAELRVLPLEEGVLIDADPAAAEGVAHGIGRHAELAGCELSVVREHFVLAALRGPRAEEALAGAGLPVPGTEEAAFARDGDLLVVRVAWGVPGFDLVGAGSATEDAVAKIGAEPATPDDLEAARIDAGRPLFGPDVNEGLLINETPLLTRAVSFSKGCYPGQESVARVHNLGAVKRLLRGLRSSDGSLEAGADVRLEGADVGTVTSAHALDRGAAAIALLRSEIMPGTAVEAGGA